MHEFYGNGKGTNECRNLGCRKQYPRLNVNKWAFDSWQSYLDYYTKTFALSLRCILFIKDILC